MTSPSIQEEKRSQVGDHLDRRRHRVSEHDLKTTTRPDSRENRLASAIQ
jgi:hypothetical protein